MQNIRIGVNTSMVPVGVKMQQVREVAVLEDPHHRAECRGEAEHVSTSALSGTRRLPVIRNSSTKVANAMSAERERQPRDDAVLGVDQLRREPGDDEVERRRRGADVLDQLLALRSTTARCRARPRGTCRVGPARRTELLREVVAEARSGMSCLVERDVVVAGDRVDAGDARFDRRACVANASIALRGRSSGRRRGPAPESASASRLAKCSRNWSVAIRLLMSSGRPGRRRGRDSRGRTGWRAATSTEADRRRRTARDGASPDRPGAARTPPSRRPRAP